jgi:bleomycin hydrolase
MRPPFLLIIALFASLSAFSQQEKGLSSAFLQQLRVSCPDDAGFRAARNALAQTDGGKVTEDMQRINSIDQLFTHRLKDERITDQKASGRCWMFSGLNTFRPLARLKLGTSDIEFSQNYIFFYDKLEKANLFLDAIIGLRDKPVTDRLMEFLLRNPVQDGGNWVGFIELIKKYGVVPKEVMPETFGSSNSHHVNMVLNMRLRQYALKIRSAAKSSDIDILRTEALKDTYRILALNFGLPPESFSWRYEKSDKTLLDAGTFTPLEFYAKFIGRNLDDYYALYSIPTLPFMKKFEIELDKAVADRPTMFFVNVPVDTLRALAMRTLLDDEPVWFGCDVGREASATNGVLATGIYDLNSLYGMDFTMSRKELFEVYSSIPDHNMVFTGVDRNGTRPQKWLVENSWGDKSGKKGFLVMTDDWFDKYVQVVVVNAKYISPDVLAAFHQPPAALPPWDPMFKSLWEAQ